jgi:hypothetical protein
MKGGEKGGDVGHVVDDMSRKGDRVGLYIACDRWPTPDYHLKSELALQFGKSVEHGSVGLHHRHSISVPNQREGGPAGPGTDVENRSSVCQVSD